MILLYAAAGGPGQGVRRPWRQPATVRLLWLHMVLAGTVRPRGEDEYQIRPDGQEKPCMQHTNIQVRSTNTAEREESFFKRSLHQGTVFFRNGLRQGWIASKHDHAKGEVYLSAENGRAGHLTELFFENGLRQGRVAFKCDHAKGEVYPSAKTGERF